MLFRSYSFNVDLTQPLAPSVSLAQASDTGMGGDSRTNQTAVQLAVTGMESGRFSASYKLDTGSWTDVSTIGGALTSGTLSFSGLAEGTHTLQMRQIDAAGNEGATSSYSFVVDTTAPTLLSPTGSDNLQTFWNARLDADGQTLRVKFSEALDASHLKIGRAHV